ncbi:MAG: hypothetical protein KDA89_17940, partial [Planctomycetaceae bacterium]|nr:hypothetical protein [Planctomycetaceae bacterium]
ATDNGVVQFHRNTTNGTLSKISEVTSPASLQELNDLVLSSDGRYLFGIRSDNSTLVMLDAASLALQQTVSDISGASAVTTNGAFVFVTSAGDSSVHVFHQQNGLLTNVQSLKNGSDGVQGIAGASGITFVSTSSGDYVMVTGAATDAVAVFLWNQTEQQLVPVQTVRNHLNDVDGLVNPAAIVASQDGQSVFVATTNTPGSPGGLVRLTNTATGGPPETISLLTEFATIESLTVSTAGGNDQITLINAPAPEVITTAIETGNGDDTVVLLDAAANVPNGADERQTSVSLGDGNDIAWLRAADAAGAVVTVNGDAGYDSIHLLSVGENANTTVNAGDDDDIVYVNARGLPSSATTTLHGDAPNPPDVTPPAGDTLIFNPEGADATGVTVTGTTADGTIQLQGFGKVQHDTFESTLIISAPAVTIGDQTTAEGQTVTISGTVSPLGNDGTLSGPLEWDLNGDGQYGDRITSVTDSGINLPFSLTLTWDELVDFGLGDDGVYTVSVRATNNHGSTETQARLTVLNTPPTVNVSGSGSVRAGDLYHVTFDALDPGNDRVQEWIVTWGDGSQERLGADAATATHQYNRPGSFQIQVSAIDEDHSSPTPTGIHSVLVTVDANQVQPGGPYTVTEGNSVTLQADLIGLPDRILWDLDGDGQFDDASGKTPTLSWNQLTGLGIADDGSFNVRVRAEWDAPQGLVAVNSTDTTLTVQNAAPQLTNLNVSRSTVNEGETVTLSGTIVDPGLRDTHTVMINWGDGTMSGVSLTTLSFSATHTYSDDSATQTGGAWLITATVKDDDGGRETQTRSVTAINVEPSLVAAGSTAVDEGSPWSLSLSAVDPGDDSIIRWTVAWGDGSIDSYDGAVVSAVHTYPDGTNAEQTVQITAIDEDGSYTTSRTVIVRNTAPDLTGLSAPDSAEGAVARVTGSLFDAGTEDNLTVQIQWGDGTEQQLDLPAGSTSFEATHVYEDDALDLVGSQSLPIHVTVTDKDGATVSGNTQIRVDNQDPVILALG